MTNKQKHLEMIQTVINRMASNSFALKGWSVALTTGVIAIANKDLNELYFLIAFLPIFAFWLLDSYYLYQEKLFRDLYDEVRIIEEDKIDFNMNTNSLKLKHNKKTYMNCVLSTTESYYYIPLLLSAPVIMILIKHGLPYVLRETFFYLD